MIDHVEGLLELLYLVLVEHGEHIAEEVNTSVSMSARDSGPGTVVEEKKAMFRIRRISN
jgi:hypothetical protein